MASVKPRRVPLEHKIVRIAAGGYTSCGLDVAGDVHCWGRLSTPEGSETGWAPRELPAFGTDVRDLAVAHPAAVCARLESDVMCWGRHRMGVLGVGATHSQHDSPPRRIPLSYEVREVSLGAYFGCARDGAGRVSCWGDNRWGQLGDGTRRSRPWPEPTEILE
jgi:alpha-tubulin suppressor-like RCC1 family protein